MEKEYDRRRSILKNSRLRTIIPIIMTIKTRHYIYLILIHHQEAPSYKINTYHLTVKKTTNSKETTTKPTTKINHNHNHKDKTTSF